MQTYKLLEDDGVLLAQPHLIKQLGRTGATFLNQIHYWIKNNKAGFIHDERCWIYNTAVEWGKQICLSERQVRHYIKKFSEMGLIIIKKLNQKNYDRTNYITINYEALNEINNHQGKTLLHPAVFAESKRKKPQNLYTKIKNKDINNKSEKIFSESKKLSSSSLNAFPDTKKQQVKQVDKLEIKKEGRVDNKQPYPLKKTTAQNMMNLWNKSFPNSKVVMDKILAKQLVAAFNHKCQKSLIYWKNYLERLQSSAFIMSNQFNLTLNWALKFKTIDRIFKGDLGVKDILVKADEEAQEKQAFVHIQGLDELSSCKKIRQMILKAIGAIKYNAWFTKVDFVEQSGELKMKAESKFVEDYILQHFGRFLKI